MTAPDPLLRQFPNVARFLGGLHQDFDICYEDIADYARSLRADAALADQLRRAAELDGPDLKALWRKSGAEILPRKSDGMRMLLLAAAAALEA